MGWFGRSGAAWFVFAGTYLLLAGTIDPVEVTAGMVCGTLSAALWIGPLGITRRRFLLAMPPRAALKPLAAILPELFTVGRALAAVAVRGTASHHGDFVGQPFAPGNDTPRSTGRRALSILGVSLAPRTFVVRGEMSDTLLLHGLPPKPPSPDHLWPAS